MGPALVLTPYGYQDYLTVRRLYWFLGSESDCIVVCNCTLLDFEMVRAPPHAGRISVSASKPIAPLLLFRWGISVSLVTWRGSVKRFVGGRPGAAGGLLGWAVWGRWGLLNVLGGARLVGIESVDEGCVTRVACGVRWIRKGGAPSGGSDGHRRGHGGGAARGDAGECACCITQNRIGPRGRAGQRSDRDGLARDRRA